MSVSVQPDGSWHADKSDYEIDEPLGNAIATMLVRLECHDLYDLGCGAGGYVNIMRNHGLWCQGFDLNPKTPEYCEGCQVYDITRPMSGFGRVHALLCMEVGEHVPRGTEQQLLDNIAYLSESVVVLSWYPVPGQGIGHINERTNEWVIEQMNMRGFTFDAITTKDLRDVATKHWFKDSLLIFHLLTK